MAAPLLQALFVAVAALMFGALYLLWLSPFLFLRRLRRNGFRGPQPVFPLGNLQEIHSSREVSANAKDGSEISHDIFAKVIPYFAKWRKIYGKVFVYWIGTEPFLYVADPHFIEQAMSGAQSNAWGKPDVFKRDRKALFGNGLLMLEGDEWHRHRNAANPVFTASNVNTMLGTMVDSASKLVQEWSFSIASGDREIDVEIAVKKTAAEIIARTSFGMDARSCATLHEKVVSMHALLFKTKRLVGVPFGGLLTARQSRQLEKLGREVDELLLSIVRRRRQFQGYPSDGGSQRGDLLGLIVAAGAQSGKEDQEERTLADADVVDECKTFFFAGHETTSIAISWTLLLLAVHREWQHKLREEIREVVGGEALDADKVNKLNKMECVFSEALRLYPTAPNVQRQAREDIRVGDGDLVIPKGTNMWIDTVGMNHDRTWWGDDVHEFKPERFERDHRGGCKQVNAFSPFGRGRRLCIGKNLSKLEYKVVLTLVLQNFSFSLSPNYRHYPAIQLTLRPSYGVPLILRPLKDNVN